MKTMTHPARQETPAQPLGPKKTLFVMVTVVGCIAILWPKVFYPMIVGPAPKPAVLKDHRGSGIRQERPPHLRPEGIHPAMRERGRAIPVMPTVPITGDRAHNVPPIPPKIIDGRPGPIPGMRPPMGAGSHQQPAPRSNSMGFIMPLYTVGIVAFFIYTIMKLVCKKSPVAPYNEVKPDPKFRQTVFTPEEDQALIKRPDDGTTKLAWKDHDAIVAAIQGIIEAADQQIQTHRVGSEKNVNDDQEETSTNLSKDTTKGEETKPEVKDNEERVEEVRDETESKKGKIEDDEVEREELDPIVLDTPVTPDSQILVSDTDTVAEEVIDEALYGSPEDPAVVLSGRMTLSLISPHLPHPEKQHPDEPHVPNGGDKEEMQVEVSNIVLMEKLEKEVEE